MKNTIFYIFIVFMLTSCMKDPDYNSLEVNLFFDFSDEIAEIYRDSNRVQLINLQKNYSLTEYTNIEGKVSFNNVEPGFYNAQLNHSFKNDLGITFYVNALGKDLTILSSLTDTIPVSVSASNSFVIKEFYYSGCLTPSGNSYSADQFVEIYNNSSELQYVDGLSIIEHESYGLEPSYFSWLKDTIVCRMIWSIPGEGEDYPLQPGESIVVARDAFDHKSDPLGNPLCPVDMGHADFEFFVFRATGGDIDGAYSPNMLEDLFTFRGNDVVFHMRGGSAIALVKIPGNDEERKNFVNNNLITKDGITSTRFYGKIPTSFVIDAVEVVFDEAHAVYKRFPVSLDAGYTYNPEGTKTGLSIRRKIEKIIDGRTIYQDTNNSSEDFIKGTQPKPWIYE